MKFKIFYMKKLNTDQKMETYLMDIFGEINSVKLIKLIQKNKKF